MLPPVIFDEFWLNQIDKKAVILSPFQPWRSQDGWTAETEEREIVDSIWHSKTIDWCCSGRGTLASPRRAAPLRMELSELTK
jgi:hypothetical protein